MAPIPPLFVIPIPVESPRTNSQISGSFICTEPSPKVYLLTFTSPPDNRLTPAFNKAFLLALDIIETRLPKGVVVTTSSIEKFYSNGLDFEAAIADPTFFSSSLHPLWRKLLTYPMPTVALMNGHAFAGGLMTAMYHDYRIMNPHRGFLCLNELDFGAALLPAMASIFRVKLPNMSVFRNMVLQARRYTALEALKDGIIDGVGAGEETLAFIAEMKLVQKAQSPAYGPLKQELYREVVKDVEGTGQSAVSEAASRLNDESEMRVKDYEALTGKRLAKL